MRAMAQRSKRIGSAVLVALTVAGCRGGVPSAIVVGNGIPSDVSGTWTMQWGPLAGTNDYTDTTFIPLGGGEKSLVVTPRTAARTGRAGGAFNPTPTSPAAPPSRPC